MGRVKGKETEFQKDVRSHFRAIRLLFTYSREWSVYGITLIMDGLYPFISIYVSARLLDALYEKRPFEEMIFWALLGAGMAFLVTTVRHVAAKYKNTLWWSMRFRMEEPMMEKAMGMDYELMEDEEVQKLRARQAEYRKYGGSAFEIFIWQMELFLTACLKLVFAIVTVAALPGAASRGGRMAGIATVAVLSAGLFWMQRTARRAMGGDHSPDEIIKGAVQALEKKCGQGTAGHLYDVGGGFGCRGRKGYPTVSSAGYAAEIWQEDVRKQQKGLSGDFQNPNGPGLSSEPVGSSPGSGSLSLYGDAGLWGSHCSGKRGALCRGNPTDGTGCHGFTV